MEQNEKKCFVHIENYTGENPIEIIYREDAPQEHLKPVSQKLPEAIDITGTIETVHNWLEKKMHLINIDNCTLFVNREKCNITLLVNETNSRCALDEELLLNTDPEDMTVKFSPTSKITGRIEMTKAYNELKVNIDHWWKPEKLSKHLRMNRAVFGQKGKEAGMDLIGLLKNIKAKISGDYEKKKELHGQISKTEYISENISHNLPESFAVEVSLFKGAPKKRYDIELDADLIDGDIMVQLISPDMNEEVESARDELIDAELEKIKKLVPKLAIIEL